jgi:hypothetical protein
MRREVKNLGVIWGSFFYRVKSDKDMLRFSDTELKIAWFTGGNEGKKFFLKLARLPISPSGQENKSKSMLIFSLITI